MRILSLAGRRLAASIPTLFLILIGVFLLLQLAPGDTVDALMAAKRGEEVWVISAEDAARYAAGEFIQMEQLARELHLKPN